MLNTITFLETQLVEYELQGITALLRLGYDNFWLVCREVLKNTSEQRNTKQHQRESTQLTLPDSRPRTTDKLNMGQTKMVSM